MSTVTGFEGTPQMKSDLFADTELGDDHSIKDAVHHAGDVEEQLLPVVTSAAPAEPRFVRKKLNSFVGFSNLPQQWHESSIRQGFVFNLLVVGESGLGKTTLLNSLFDLSKEPTENRVNTSFKRSDVSYSDFDAEMAADDSVTIHPTTLEFEENGIKLRLSVVETPGFGDRINNTDAWKPIAKEIERRFDEFFDAEAATTRDTIADNRLHACLYFLEPSGHCIKPLDIVVMKKLHKKVNLIPIVGRADGLTAEELKVQKQLIIDDLHYQEIQFFKPKTYASDDDEMTAETAELVASIPFAVVSSPHDDFAGKRVYPWGEVTTTNEKYSDFLKLRALLIQNHLQDLRESTASDLYESYRTEKMLNAGIQQDQSVFRDIDPAARQEERRLQHVQRMAKMEAEMRQVFQAKVTEKESRLKRSENELFTKHQEIKEQLKKQRAELEARKAKLEQAAAAVPIAQEKRRKGFSLR